VHVAELKVPEPDAENVTVPDGVVGEPLVSLTVAVHVVAVLTTTVEGEQETEVEVVWRLVTVNVVELGPLLVWSVSPG